MATSMLTQPCLRASLPSSQIVNQTPDDRFCCLNLPFSRRCIFLSCQLSSTHSIGSPCLWKDFGLRASLCSPSTSRSHSTTGDGTDEQAENVVDAAVDSSLHRGEVGDSRVLGSILDSHARIMVDRNANTEQDSPSVSSGQNGSANELDSTSELESVRPGEPTALDFEIYASQLMDGFMSRPTPEPASFGGGSEEYWGEVEGEDPNAAISRNEPDPGNFIRYVNGTHSTLLSNLDSRSAAAPVVDTPVAATPIAAAPIAAAPVEQPTAESAEAEPQIPETKSEYYEPRVGDIVLGAVVSGNEHKFDLEIGAERLGLMLSKDLRPFLETNLDHIFYKIPSEDSQKQEEIIPPIGKSLIVEDKSAYNVGPLRGSLVDVGTVITAEVQGMTLGDGRAILSVRPPARRIAWHRVKQLKQHDEAIEIEITQWNDGGLLGFVEGLRAFLPKSELIKRPDGTATLKQYVGRRIPVLITRVVEEENTLIISEFKAWVKKNIRLGLLHNATVSRLYPYGMQVEVDNTRVRGFVHISGISNEYVKRVKDLFSEGEKVKVMVTKSRDPDQVYFSIADLESDRGLIIRDKERVFREAEEMARRFRERLPQEEEESMGQSVQGSECEFQDPTIANLSWLELDDE